MAPAWKYIRMSVSYSSETELAKIFFQRSEKQNKYIERMRERKMIKQMCLSERQKSSEFFLPLFYKLK